tara:strand:+ start:96 stop:308 length:213 start_codon:yes stop_codon:yes gene_type:complete
MYGSSKQMKKAPTKKAPTKKPKQLTEAQKKKLDKHSVHHTKKHMNMMKKDMMNGMSFKMAHEKAMKEIGK